MVFLNVARFSKLEVKFLGSLLTIAQSAGILG